MMAFVSVSLFFLYLFVSGPFNQELLVPRNCCVGCVKLFQLSDHDFLNFLGKGRVF